MIEATYLDNSGSMAGIETEGTLSGNLHTFNTEVDAPHGQGGGTSFGPIFAHARAVGYKSIRVVTDGYGEFDATKVEKRPVFPDLAIEWVIG